MFQAGAERSDLALRPRTAHPGTGRAGPGVISIQARRPYVLLRCNGMQVFHIGIDLFRAGGEKRERKKATKMSLLEADQ